MRFRIALWASAGFLVASFWALYLFPAAALHSGPTLALARITCPIALAGFGISVYWALPANAATYALLGLLFEMIRHGRISAQL
jgi:hypothetical protein